MHYEQTEMDYILVKQLQAQGFSLHHENKT